MQRRNKMAEIKLIKMKRGGDIKPFSADVHPDEVENYLTAGWERVKETEAADPKPKAKGKK